MRRKDREISREEALAIVDKAPYGVLSTAVEGEPYGIPLSFGRAGNVLYFHCALQGRKTDALRTRSRVCVTFVGGAECPPDNFTVIYESAVVSGTALEITEDKEKIRGLRIICERFTPAHIQAFDRAIEESLAVTAVWKIGIESISGKRRKKP